MAVRPILFGALLGVLLVLFGLPLAPLSWVLPLLVQPLAVAFVLGALARPHLPKVGGWAR
ncbi:hypothetical protein ACFY2G_04220 [Streptomyces collinus]|uniref:hypothetical protein n=1 Tax=Streptomyces collinus TaxID=42684 RepID=UPI0036ADF1FE